MVNRRLLVVTFVVFCAVSEDAMALKCYNGEASFFENREGLRVPGRLREPRLLDCGRHKDWRFGDLCLSYYAKTDLKFGRDGDGIEVLSGTWSKRCVDRSSRTGIIVEFAGDFSDRCIESKKGLMNGTAIMCICNTDGCNQEIELDVKSNP